MTTIEPSGNRQDLYFNVNNTADATVTLVAAASGKTILLSRIIVSTETADTITIKMGSTTIIGPIYCGAPGGVAIDMYPHRYKSAAGEALTLEKGTAATKVTANGFYDQM